MSSWSIALLGAIAGFTIFLGLPFGRVQKPSLGLRVVLNGTAIGVLLFLLWDVLVHAFDPVEAALTEVAIDHTGTWARFAELAGTVVVGVVVGLMSLVYYDRWMANRRSRVPVTSFGPGAAAVGELTKPRVDSPADVGRRLALMIAVGIGLHNFSEGLAIGQSAASGEISLALLLIIGFGLHNATEGFGIVAPLTGGRDRPGWGFLALLGLIGGGPTFVGTLIGQAVVSDILSVGFLALAAGSILYVVMQLLRVADRMGRRELLCWALLLGLFLGFATDFIIVAAGA
jgi:zinc transporter, ZIP family